MSDPTGRAPVMVVLSHPRSLHASGAGAPSPASLVQTVAGRVTAALGSSGAELIIHDLYAEGFDPVLVSDQLPDVDDVVGEDTAEQVDPLVARHAAELAEARALVVIHPDWWGKPPAIMTGWLDRVLMPALVRQRLPRLRRLLVINTRTPDRTASNHAAGDSDPLGMIWRESVGRHLASGQLERMVLRTDAADREALLSAVTRASGWAAGGPR
ncbi:NAD(P)H-dependent oxidoreductase [Propionibacteriaceae bacterium Y1700]|uniref:NAD(P)H-dependent oxidoreductase n=1 Tax=Microlunatus sp. Y1700 TaxID=3418487 RepID=UPI003DA78150